MLYFDVAVYEQRVEIKEVSKLAIYHQKARVDGVQYLYRITKGKPDKPKHKDWYGRGQNHVYYHAKNAGHNVVFEAVSYPRGTKQETDY